MGADEAGGADLFWHFLGYKSSKGARSEPSLLRDGTPPAIAEDSHCYALKSDGQLGQLLVEWGDTGTEENGDEDERNNGKWKTPKGDLAAEPHNPTKKKRDEVIVCPSSNCNPIDEDWGCIAINPQETSLRRLSDITTSDLDSDRVSDITTSDFDLDKEDIHSKEEKGDGEAGSLPPPLEFWQKLRALSMAEGQAEEEELGDGLPIFDEEDRGVPPANGRAGDNNETPLNNYHKDKDCVGHASQGRLRQVDEAKFEDCANGTCTRSGQLMDLFN